MFKVEKVNDVYHIVLEEKKLTTKMTLSEVDLLIEFESNETMKEDCMDLLKFYAPYRIIYFLQKNEKLLEKIKKETCLFVRTSYEEETDYSTFHFFLSDRIEYEKINDELIIRFVTFSIDKGKCDTNAFTCILGNKKQILQLDNDEESIEIKNEAKKFVPVPAIAIDEFKKKILKDKRFKKIIKKAVKFQQEIKKIEEIDVLPIENEKVENAVFQGEFYKQYTFHDYSFDIEIKYTDYEISEFYLKYNDRRYILGKISPILKEKIKSHFIKTSKNRVRYLMTR